MHPAALRIKGTALVVKRFIILSSFDLNKLLVFFYLTIKLPMHFNMINAVILT